MCALLQTQGKKEVMEVDEGLKGLADVESTRGNAFFSISSFLSPSGEEQRLFVLCRSASEGEGDGLRRGQMMRSPVGRLSCTSR